ncbi:MAG: FkbM family methyltransferase [Phycisphaeraceae bacterium]
MPMNSLIAFVRWYNHACPWNHYKRAMSRWAAERLGDADEPRICERVQGGLRMRLDLSNDAQKLTYLNHYEPVTLRLLRRILRPGDVFVDGGANVGLLTLVAARCVGAQGSVYAFEPQPAALARLEENVRLNDAGNVTIVPKCCWDEAGTNTLFTERGNSIGKVSMRQSAEAADTGATGAEPMVAETVRMDDVVDGPVRLIKLDVEGAELPALRGARGLFEAAPPHLIVELQCATAEPFGYHPMEIVDWVLERGAYRLHLIERKRHRPINRDALARLLDERPDKLRNLWCEPVG